MSKKIISSKPSPAVEQLVVLKQTGGWDDDLLKFDFPSQRLFVVLRSWSERNWIYRLFGGGRRLSDTERRRLISARFQIQYWARFGA